jgi:hypothetical protein
MTSFYCRQRKWKKLIGFEQRKLRKIGGEVASTEYVCICGYSAKC